MFGPHHHPHGPFFGPPPPMFGPRFGPPPPPFYGPPHYYGYYGPRRYHNPCCNIE